MKNITNRVLNTWSVFCAGALAGFAVCGLLLQVGYSSWVLGLSWMVLLPIGVVAMFLPHLLLAIYRQSQKRKKRQKELAAKETPPKVEW